MGHFVKMQVWVGSMRDGDCGAASPTSSPQVPPELRATDHTLSRRAAREGTCRPPAHCTPASLLESHRTQEAHRLMEFSQGLPALGGADNNLLCWRSNLLFVGPFPICLLISSHLAPSSKEESEVQGGPRFPSSSGRCGTEKLTYLPRTYGHR